MYIPGVGPIAKVAQCMLLNRSSKDSKKLIQDAIIERQKLGENDVNFDPLIIHCEGGTSNGKYLIKFKRGAFVSCLSVWPRVHKHHSYFQSSCTGVIDGLPHYLIGCALPFGCVTKIIMPVFRPNEFFWKNH